MFAPLADGITLSAGGYFYVLSQETAGADAFYDFDLSVTPTSDFVVVMAIYSTTDTGPYVRMGIENNCYGPVNATYVTA
jgi:hypothetical protein